MSAVRKRAIQNELLLLRCKRGDRDAYPELVQLWERPLFYYIRKLVRTEEDAWDVLQEVWLVAFKNIASIHDMRNLSAWLYRVARNQAISHFRKDVRFTQAENEEELETTNQDIPDFEPSVSQVHEIHDALNRLSLPHREVLTLFFLEDFSVDEIAEIIELPAGTVKSRLHYAKKEMRKLLGCEEDTHVT